MYGGKLQKMKFEYTGESIEAVLDRLPTAKVLSEEEGSIWCRQRCLGRGSICGLGAKERRLEWWNEGNCEQGQAGMECFLILRVASCQSSIAGKSDRVKADSAKKRLK